MVILYCDMGDSRRYTMAVQPVLVVRVCTIVNGGFEASSYSLWESLQSHTHTRTLTLTPTISAGHTKAHYRSSKYNFRCAHNFGVSREGQMSHSHSHSHCHCHCRSHYISIPMHSSYSIPFSQSLPTHSCKSLQSHTHTRTPTLTPRISADHTKNDYCSSNYNFRCPHNFGVARE